MRALRRVVAEYPPLGEAARTRQQCARVDHALAREASARESVHVQLPTERAVRVAAARPGEDERKIRLAGALKLRVDARMDDGVTRRDRVRARVDHRAAQRVQHRADKLARRAGIDARVAVEREDIPRAAQRVLFARHLKLALLVAQELCQLQYRPALALVRGVALAVKAARAREKVEASAVFAVEAHNGLAHGTDERFVRVRAGAVRLRQVGEQSERQRRALAPAGVVKLLQPLRARLRAEKR